MHSPLRYALPALLALALPAALTSQSRADSVPTTSAARDGTQEGLASFYARRRNGRRTASGERFDNAALVAAHPWLPFGTRVRVTDLDNGRSVDVRIIDRGPASARQRRGYVIDLSRAAARSLEFLKRGRARVRLDVEKR